MSAPPLDDLEALALSWRLHLQSRNRSPRTIQTYLDALERFTRYLNRQALSTEILTIDRRVVEGFIGDQLACHSAGTAVVRFRSLQQFFRWATEDSVIPINPMDRMKPPKTPDVPVAVISSDDIRKLLATCEMRPGHSKPRGLDSADLGGLFTGKGSRQYPPQRRFDDKRDLAILRLFVDSPMRLSEMANLRLEGPDGPDLILPEGSLRVVGKGNKTRHTSVGMKAAKALTDYLRLRARHDEAGLPWLWIGAKGHFTHAGISQMVRRRAKLAGIDHVHPHQFRHTFAHAWLSDGGNEGDLMEIAGWSSHDMLRRYAKSTAAQRARDAQKRRGIGDKI